MAEPTPSRPPLTPDEHVRLTEFARACKAAARAVMLYPTGHPAIGATLGRIVHVTSRETLRRAPRREPTRRSPSSPRCSTAT
jgi:hypothetical protein